MKNRKTGKGDIYERRNFFYLYSSSGVHGAVQNMKHRTDTYFEELTIFDKRKQQREESGGTQEGYK